MHLGNTPTFVADRQEVIEISYTSCQQLVDNISKWKVSDEDMQPDHRPITLNILRAYSQGALILGNIWKTSWDQYK